MNKPAHYPMYVCKIFARQFPFYLIQLGNMWHHMECKTAKTWKEFPAISRWESKENCKGIFITRISELEKDLPKSSPSYVYNMDLSYLKSLASNFVP